MNRRSFFRSLFSSVAVAAVKPWNFVASKFVPIDPPVQVYPFNPKEYSGKVDWVCETKYGLLKGDKRYATPIIYKRETP